MCRFLSLSLVLMLSLVCRVEACTSLIISGDYTYNGCALLLKQRDGLPYDNCVTELVGQKYRMLALINSNDTSRCNALSGVNEVNFAIVNTATYNLGSRDTKIHLSPGRVMYTALSTCASVAEFEALLDTLQSQTTLVPANFGVIDASGGGAFYEVGHSGWAKYDVNDKNVAPNGFLVRTNFSLCETEAQGRGYDRYDTAVELLNQAVVDHVKISADWVFDNICRSVENRVKGVRPSSSENPGRYVEREFIANRHTSSAVLFEGVHGRYRESVMWTLLGYPMTGLAVPLMLSEPLPDFVQAVNDEGHAAICDWALCLKDKVLTVDGKKVYINYPLLFSDNNVGITQKIMLEERALSKLFRSARQSRDSRRTRLFSKLYDHCRDFQGVGWQ